MNNSYTLTAGSPLLRAGLTVSTTTSLKYAPQAYTDLLELVRQINNRARVVDSTPSGGEKP
jgi:hypothetical protein